MNHRKAQEIYNILVDHYDLCKNDPESIILRNIDGVTLKSPLFISWEITSICNLKCEHCRAADNNSRNLFQNYSIDQYKTLIKQFSDMEIYRLGITGGEPFLHPLFFQILEECKKYKLQLIIYTNATLVNRDNAKKLKRLLDEDDIVHVSLDGGNQKSNDAQRGKGSFKSTINALKLLSENDINIRLNIVPTLFNIDSIIEMCDLAIKYNVKEFGASPLMTAGRAKSTDLAPDQSKLFDIEIDVVKRLKNTNVSYIGGISGTVHSYLYIPELFDKNIYKLNRQPSNKKYCDAGTRKLFIDSMGDLYSCSLFASDKKFIIGNAFHDSIEDIWNSEKCVAYREGFELDTECKSCKLVSLCNGGCPALTYLHTKKLIGIDPRCQKFVESV